MHDPEKEKHEWTDFISVILSHYLLIALFVALSCITAAIVTYYIPKEYISSAVIFPANTNSLDDIVRNPQFGYDVDADQLIQVLQSRMIRDSIVKKFDLLKYYSIDKRQADWDFRLKNNFERDIKFEKTPYMSVIISARTRDPEMSAKIANQIVKLIGTVREKLLKKNVFLDLKALQYDYDVLKKDLDSIGEIVNQLTSLRKNVRQYVQTERYVSLIFDKEQMKDDESGKALQLVVNQYNNKLTWFYDVQNKLKNANLMSKRPLPEVYVIESAVPSFQKSYPKYSTNLMMAFSCSLVFISFLLFFIEKIRKNHSNPVLK